MEIRSIPALLKRLINKKQVQRFVLAALVAGIFIACGWRVIELTSENSSLRKEVAQLLIYEERANEQEQYIRDLEEKIKNLNGTITDMTMVLDTLETSLKNLEKNLLVLDDVKEKTGK